MEYKKVQTRGKWHIFCREIGKKRWVYYQDSDGSKLDFTDEAEVDTKIAELSGVFGVGGVLCGLK